MPSGFKDGNGDWKQYMELSPVPEVVDFHFSDFGPREVPYWEAMDRVWGLTVEALEKVQEEGQAWVLFTHGRSTSRRGKTTARSGG
jgi:hypothetical protein